MYYIVIALLSSSITAGQGGSTMNVDDRFEEWVDAQLLEAVKEAQEYEDEHGMDNWGAVIPNCLVSRMAMVIIKNLK